MLEGEVLELFNHRYLNFKTNNYIFTGVENFSLLDSVPEKCSIVVQENDIDVSFAQNIKIDIEEIDVRDILSYTLRVLQKQSFLDVNFDYNLEFNNKFDLLKFQGVLRTYNRVVQLIFFNLEKLSIKDQMLFNEIYHFNSIFFNANAFIKENNFSTYFLGNGTVLDNREDYEKVKLIKR